ncbi:uncharacterized protein [Spinacia oleracea]|uniref:RNase H type-1 domain-containing protein n=1 Tax=Spinacia oleracea TaxID=3562 RepID=A0ABM3RRE9_SPIOL|nr:uncharacterized protein LOC130471872 [Spinacia oleracea]
MICEQVFRKLRKNEPKVWDKDYQHAFDTIKGYLSNPPVLKPTILGTPLRLYLTTNDTAVGAMLAQEIKGKENDVYNLSKKLLEYETKYTQLERLSISLVWASKKLKHYMLSLIVHGSLVSDFMADCPIEAEEESYDLPNKKILMTSDDSWSLHFDGASNQCGCGVGVILIDPEDTHTLLSTKLQFNFTNNAAEYEVCIMGLEAAIALGVHKL